MQGAEHAVSDVPVLLAVLAEHGVFEREFCLCHVPRPAAEPEDSDEMRLHVPRFKVGEGCSGLAAVGYAAGGKVFEELRVLLRCNGCHCFHPSLMCRHLLIVVSRQSGVVP